jgi:hypothetical protein
MGCLGEIAGGDREEWFMAGYSFELRAGIRHVGAGKMPRRTLTVEAKR